MDKKDLQSALTKLGKALPAAIPGFGPVFVDLKGQFTDEDLARIIREAALSADEKRALLAGPAAILAGVQEITDEASRSMLDALVAQENRLYCLLEIIRDAIPSREEDADGPHDLVAVIPTGGTARGLWPLTSVQPKCLVAIDRKPLLAHILAGLDQARFTRAIVTADDWHPMVESYGQAFYRGPIDVEYVQVRATPAQQLKQLAENGSLSDPFLLHYCDIRLHKVDWPWVFSSYARNRDSARGSFVGMVLASRWLRLGVGIIRPLNDDFVGEFVEHPERPLSTDLIGTGVALFETRFIDHIRPEDGSVFADVVPRAIKREKAKLAYCPLPSWDHIQHMDDLFDCQVGYYPHMAGRPAAMSRTIRPEERGTRKAG